MMKMNNIMENSKVSNYLESDNLNVYRCAKIEYQTKLGCGFLIKSHLYGNITSPEVCVVKITNHENMSCPSSS